MLPLFSLNPNIHGEHSELRSQNATSNTSRLEHDQTGQNTRVGWLDSQEETAVSDYPVWTRTDLTRVGQRAVSSALELGNCSFTSELSDSAGTRVRLEMGYKI